jgi:putative transposase
MPNHFHAVVRADQDRALSAYFHWVQGCYSRMLRIKTHTSGDGHVFQQRFWTGAIQDDWHFLNVLKYVERNPVAAELVPRAEQWPWSSLVMREKDAPFLIDPPPVRLPADWIGYVNADPCPEEAD